MAATATARKAPRVTARTRRAPRPAPVRAARPAPRRAPRPAPRPLPRLVPVAVGRTAVAVGDLADSGLVLRLTRSRIWIGLLGSLLVGIVALNVFALSLNASSSKTAGIADELRSENSALTTQIADRLSNERAQQAAAQLGLIVPEPGAILYLDPKPGDAAAAASRLRRGAITIGTTYVPPVTTVTPELVAPTATETPVTTDQAAIDTTVGAEATATADQAEATATADQAATATSAATAAGGITAAP
jgi:hypothetical protein